MEEAKIKDVSLRQWCDITVREWVDKIDKQRIGRRLIRKNGKVYVAWTYALRKSFSSHVQTSANGDFEKITFFYNYYGKFVDMGVGKGTNIGSVQDNSDSRRLEGKMTGNRRRAKKWYSKTMAGRTITLSKLLAEEYGAKAMASVVENLPPNVTLEM